MKLKIGVALLVLSIILIAGAIWQTLNRPDLSIPARQRPGLPQPGPDRLQTDDDGDDSRRGGGGPTPNRHGVTTEMIDADELLPRIDAAIQPWTSPVLHARMSCRFPNTRKEKRRILERYEVQLRRDHAAIRLDLTDAFHDTLLVTVVLPGDAPASAWNEKTGAFYQFHATTLDELIIEIAQEPDAHPVFRVLRPLRLLLTGGARRDYQEALSADREAYRQTGAGGDTLLHYRLYAPANAQSVSLFIDAETEQLRGFYFSEPGDFKQRDILAAEGRGRKVEKRPGSDDFFAVDIDYFTADAAVDATLFERPATTTMTFDSLEEFGKGLNWSSVPFN